MLAAIQAGLAARKGEQGVDQLLEVLLGCEYALVSPTQRAHVGLGTGKRDLDEGALACQWRAQLVGGVGDELALRVVGVLERLQDASGDEPSKREREHRHRRQSDPGLDRQISQHVPVPAVVLGDEMVQVGV